VVTLVPSSFEEVPSC